MSTPENASGSHLPFAPPRPTLVATGFFTLWIAILSLPIWIGRFLAGPYSDQYTTGYAYRAWAAEQWKTMGQVPLWNAEIFGGMPFVAGMHGDIFYPTAWLRLLLPIHVAMNIGFVVHYVLCGLFAYLLLRKLRVSWTGSVVGGLAYQLSGVIASYVHPGHDGKLFVTALLPLALLALVMALRDKRWGGYPLLALAAGLGFLSPHPQLLYYLLVASGLFALYLTFGEPTDEAIAPRVVRLAGSLAAIFLGFGVGAIQMVPFYAYIPYSLRAESVGGWERATSFGIPWHHVPEFFLSGFVGETESQTYWGSNGLKLHSEYLGLPALALAVLGATAPTRRRLKLWIGGIGLLFLLVSLGAATPFYRLWYAVMPFMKQVRAPGMALYVVSLVIAILAALGTERLERREGNLHAKIWLGVAAVVGLLALFGGIGVLAEAFASGVQSRIPGYPAIERAVAAANPIRWAAFASAASLAALAGVALMMFRERIDRRAALLLLAGVVGTDLMWNARPFWRFSETAQRLGGDAITARLQAIEPPHRVLNFSVYEGAGLMAYGIPDLVGHHGTQLQAFADVLDGTDLRARNLLSPNVWTLFAINRVVLPAGSIDSIRGFTEVLSNVTTAEGRQASLFERDDPLPYARIVPVAVQVPANEMVPSLLSPRFPFDRAVLVDSTAGIDAPRLDAFPDSVPASVTVPEWAPGRMRLEISPPAPQEGFVIVSENWYFDWRATVDGNPVDTFRGNGSLLTVPVPAGAQTIELVFASNQYRLGKAISLASVLIIAIGMVAPVVLRRRGSG